MKPIAAMMMTLAQFDCGSISPPWIDRVSGEGPEKNDEGEYCQEDRRSQFIIGQATDEAGKLAVFQVSSAAVITPTHNWSKRCVLDRKRIPAKPNDG